MQIILISLRTLGASELLLLLSRFSHLFFFPSCLFSCCNCCCFWSTPPPPPPYISSSSSIAAIRLSPLSSPLVWSLDLCLLSSLCRRPGLTLCGSPIQEEGDWEICGGVVGWGWEIWGSGATFWHLHLIRAGAKFSQWSQEFSKKKKKKSHSRGNAMDLMSCIWVLL